AVEAGDGAVAHDIAAGDRAPAVAVALGDNGELRAGGGLVEVAPPALPGAPAEVRAARRALAREVDLLDRVLPDVADDEVVGDAVEREAPRVAQAVGIDLGQRAGAVDEGVARRRHEG